MWHDGWKPRVAIISPSPVSLKPDGKPDDAASGAWLSTQKKDDVLPRFRLKRKKGIIAYPTQIDLFLPQQKQRPFCVQPPKNSSPMFVTDRISVRRIIFGLWGGIGNSYEKIGRPLRKNSRSTACYFIRKAMLSRYLYFYRSFKQMIAIAILGISKLRKSLG